MKSKKALFEFFKSKYNKDLNLQSKGISDETYGKASYIYVYDTAKTLGVSREQALKDLAAAGFPRIGVWGSSCNAEQHYGLEIPVSYFRGKNWNV